MAAEPYDLAPEETRRAADTARAILVRQVATGAGIPENQTRYVLDCLALVLSSYRPLEVFGLCGNLVQRGHDLRKERDGDDKT